MKSAERPRGGLAHWTEYQAVLHPPGARPRYAVCSAEQRFAPTWYLNGGIVTNREPRSCHPSLTPSQLCRTKDGWLFIMCNKEKFWTALAEAVGKPEWATDPEYSTFAARLKNREQVTQELDAVLTTATTAEWISRLGGKVPIAPVYDVQQALQNPFVAEQQLVLDFQHPEHGKIRRVASPVRLESGQRPD